MEQHMELLGTVGSQGVVELLKHGGRQLLQRDPSERQRFVCGE